MSGKYLGPAERQVIAQAWGSYSSVAEIAQRLGVARKTIYEELRRGQDGEKLDHNQRPVYDPELAQRRFQANLRRRGHAKTEN
uniref:RNAseH protein n=1 Tax=Dulem virus 34 TaxID=3145752 RepID=A0AAU8B6W6_9CAUD